MITTSHGYRYAIGLVMQNRGATAIRMRTDPENAATEDILDANAQQPMGNITCPNGSNSLVWMRPLSETESATIILRYTESN